MRLEAGGSPCPDRKPLCCGRGRGGPCRPPLGHPAAGVLFAFEEMKSRRDTSLIVAACASAIGAHLMIRIVFGMGRILPFAGFEAPPLSSFWIVALEGAVFGVLGVGYNKTLLWLHDREAGQTLIPDRWRALPPLLLAGCLALFAPLLIGGGESLIIFVGEHDVALKTLILLLAFKYLFAQYSTVASIPGGLLMPILCLGALWGRLWAELPVSALAAHGLASGSVQPYVLFGMVSYFAATVRAPLTGIVLVTEMSGTYTCLPGSLLAGLIACKVANLLHCPPVYDSLKERIRLIRDTPLLFLLFRLWCPFPVFKECSVRFSCFAQKSSEARRKVSNTFSGTANPSLLPSSRIAPAQAHAYPGDPRGEGGSHPSPVPASKRGFRRHSVARGVDFRSFT